MKLPTTAMADFFPRCDVRAASGKHSPVREAPEPSPQQALPGTAARPPCSGDTPPELASSEHRGHEIRSPSSKPQLASAWELTQEESQPILHEPSLHQPSSSRWGPEDSKSGSERTSPRPSTGATQGLTASLSSALFLLGKEAGMLVLFSKILKEQESHTVL